MRKLKRTEVTFRLDHFPEQISIEGNCSAVDPETDAATEQMIRDQLADGNTWAWCYVVVKATFGGLTGVDTLGGCSYKSEEDFRQPGGYFDDMKHEAFCRLQEELDLIEQLLEEESDESEENPMVDEVLRAAEGT